MAEEKSNHLDELNSSHYYEIAEGQPDITRWNIMDETGKKIGTVRDLLFDKEDKKVRYIVTNLKEGILEEDRRVLIPIGKARLKTEDKRVVVPQVTRGNLSKLPDYSSTKDMTTEDERTIRTVFATEGTAQETGAYDRSRFYEHEDFNEERFYEGEKTVSKGPTDKFPGEGVKPGEGAERKPMSRIKKREVNRTVEERVEDNFEAKRTTSQSESEGRDHQNEDKYILKTGETSKGSGAKKKARVVEKVSGEKEGTNTGTTRSTSEGDRRSSIDKEKNPDRRSE